MTPDRTAVRRPARAATVARVAALGGDRAWLLAAAATLTLGAGAVAWQAPVAGTVWWHVADGEVLRRGLSLAHAPFVAGRPAPFDLRGWLWDWLLAAVARAGGAGGLALVGAGAGLLLGAVLSWAAVARAAPVRVHPWALVGAGALGLAGMAGFLGGRDTIWLPIWFAALLGLLAQARAGRRWALAGVPVVLVLWANTQGDVVLGVLTVALEVLLSRRRAPAGGAPLPWWLALTALIAPAIGPHGVLWVEGIPLSFGQFGEPAALGGWGSPDFHPLARRVTEVAAVGLLASYALVGRRARAVDAWPAVGAVVLALLFSRYVPLLMVLVAVQAPRHLSLAVRSLPDAWRAGPGGPSLRRWAAVPVLAAALLLVGAGWRVERAGGPARAVARALPVAAATWLGRHPVAGAWLTSADYGSYLASRFPDGGHLLCLGDPVPLAGAALDRCGVFAVLGPSTGRLLRRAGVRLAVLPRAAPEAGLLQAWGWRVAASAGPALVLRPPPGGRAA